MKTMPETDRVKPFDTCGQTRPATHGVDPTWLPEYAGRSSPSEDAVEAKQPNRFQSEGVGRERAG